MIKNLVFFLAVFLILIYPTHVFAQRTFLSKTAESLPINDIESTGSAAATPSAIVIDPKVFVQIDLTSPEQRMAQEEFKSLYVKRPIDSPTFLNFIGYTIQYAVRSGVPVNIVILILLLPALATMVVFVRQIIGLPTLELLVPIALAITFVATGLTIGTILLTSILFASILSRIILKKIRIMQLPKMALSMFLVAIFVFAALIVSVSLRLFDVTHLSFLPVLLLILLSDKIVALQLARGNMPAIIITFFTLVLGAVGYLMLTLPAIRQFVLLYPEIILILIPINIIIGRYFGLRLTEYHRFQAFRRYVNK